MALPPLISSIGPYGLELSGTVNPDVNWPGANVIFYVPLRVPEACTVLRVFWANGSAVSGNVNLGLYSSAGVKAWECGSTAQAGTNQLQFVDIADESVSAGLYYVALQHSGTGRIIRAAPGLIQLQTWGMFKEAAASFALPASATRVKTSYNFLPSFGLDLRGAV